MSLPNQCVHGDWQNLIVLDACRFDVFKAVASTLGLRGDLKKVWTITAETIGWYQNNWSGSYPDTCLLSAHPVSFWSRYGINERFGGAHRLWSDDVDVYTDACNSVDLAVEAIKESTYNRFLIHLMPPHLPFIDDQGKAFLHSLGYPENLQGEAICNALSTHGREQGWTSLQHFYTQSLKTILRLLERHRDVFQGITIVTSDHGELLGEHGYYFHGGEGVKYPTTAALHEVPWFDWRPT